jgi:hypothetical protein
VFSFVKKRKERKRKNCQIVFQNDFCHFAFSINKTFYDSTFASICAINVLDFGYFIGVQWYFINLKFSNEVDHLFRSLLFFCPFCNQVATFIMLNFKSSLCDLNTRPLSDIPFANISSVSGVFCREKILILTKFNMTYFFHGLRPWCCV